ncbi:MAG TPA: hypothetical protein VN031_00105 [Candidatus Microsaccharimonas sp.]|nr:hypothetical protein [Candidatus Microsaccharimonas sp.]
MNNKRVYFIMLGVIGLLLVGVIGGTYEVNNVLEAKAKHLVDLKLQSKVISTQQVGLLQAKKQIAQYASFEETAKSIVPQDKDQAEAVREIAKLASDSGIPRLSSVTFPISTLGGIAGTTTTGTSAAAKSKSTLTQLTPVKGITGLYELQITIQQTSDSTIPYSKFLTFLDKLEQNRRTAQVSSIALQPNTTQPDNVAFTLVINEFIKP